MSMYFWAPVLFMWGIVYGVVSIVWVAAILSLIWDFFTPSKKQDPDDLIPS